jgi:polyphosphate kinase 2 (PPK2 family)
LTVASLDDVDLSAKLPKRKGIERLQVAQHRLLALRLQAGAQIGSGELGPPLCVLFEGWDASGKGGAIRRLTSPLDPRHVNVAQFAAPNPREKRHHFLWRFWPELPGWGGMAVLDRSWYGRVLVERVEGFATKREWRRAYDEIVAFERSLANEGMVLVKFWIHVSEKEQRRRFEARKTDPLKSWKLTDEDWRNIAKRDEYEQAVSDMLRRTDHKHSRWTVIAGESKPYARVAVLEAVIEALEQGLRDAGQEPIALAAEL